MERIQFNSTDVAGNISQQIITDATLISMGGIILFENLIAMLILYRCKRLNFQIKILSMNLVVSDLSLGAILCLPLSFYEFGDNCEFKKYLLFCCLNVSLFTVTMYNLDRCLIFALAMEYYKYVTKLRLIFVCSLLWGTGVLTSYFMFYSEELPFKIGCRYVYELKRNPVSQSTKYLLLSTIVSNCFMYTYLLYYIRRRICRTGDVGSLSTVQEIKIVQKLSVITGTFLVIATPFYITLAFPILDYSKPSGKTIHNACGMLLGLNSAMNPVFYIWRMQEPRYHLKLLIMQWNTAYCEKLRQEYNRKTASYSMSSSASTDTSKL